MVLNCSIRYCNKRGKFLNSDCSVLPSKRGNLAASKQCAKKVVSDSPGLLDFAIRLVNSVFNLPNRQVMFVEDSNNIRTVKSILPIKKLLGLVEMTSGLVNASFSLPEWQAIKMIFFAPWNRVLYKVPSDDRCNSTIQCRTVQFFEEYLLKVVKYKKLSLNYQVG